MKNSIAKEIAYASVLSAVLIAGKFALSFLPNVEMVSAIIILATIYFGIKISLPAVFVFCIIDAFIYGFYPAVLIQYLFHFPLLCVITYLFSKKTTEILPFVLLSFAFSILFWFETPILNVIFKFSLFLPTLISGIPFFVAQTISSIAFLIALYKPFQVIGKWSNN